MALADRLAEGTQAEPGGASFPVLDRAWAEFDARDREIFMNYLTTKTKKGRYLYSAEFVSDELTAENFPVSPSWITAARRRGWEPSA